MDIHDKIKFNKQLTGSQSNSQSHTQSNNHLCNQTTHERLAFSAFGILLTTTALAGVVASSIPASADTSTATDNTSSSVSVTVSSACTITSDHADGISKTINPGIRDDELGTTTMTVLCNNSDGYDVYAVGYTNNEWKNNQMIGNNNSSSNYFNTRNRGDGSYTDTSHWYMKLDKPTGSNISIENNYDNYSRIPGTSDKQDAGDDTDEGYIKVASLDATTQGISSADFQVTYGAYVTSAQPADTYTGQVKYTIVDPHGADAPEARDPNLSDLTYMQELASMDTEEKAALIANTPTDTQYQLKDKRDGKTYWVAKLKDGNVWMTQNLDLNLESTPNQVAALTSENTDLNTYGSEAYTAGNGYSCSNPSTTTNCTADGETITWTPARGTINYVSDAETALEKIPDWTNDYDTPYSVDTGDWYWSGKYYTSGLCYVDNSDQTCDYAAKPSNVYSTYFSTTPYTLNGTHGHVGNYYNWTAAIAANDSSSYTTPTYDNTSGDPSNSICPAGWRLPKDGDSSKTTSDFDKLNTQYNSGVTNTDAGLIAAPLFFTRSGNVWTDALHTAGYFGLYWSSTVESAQQARRLYFSSGLVHTANLDNHRNGSSLRCLTR